MEYSQLTTKDLIGHTQNVIKELEVKCHGLELQIAMNQRLQHYYAKLKEPNKNGKEAARQGVARDQSALLEMQIGLPVLTAHLAELQELDAAEDAAKETAKASDTEPETDLDEAPIDATEEPEPTPIESKSRRNGKADQVRELVPVV